MNFFDLLARVDSANFSPAAAARLKAAIEQDAFDAAQARIAPRPAAPEAEQQHVDTASVARLEAAEQRLERLQQKARDERARARRDRERAITRMQARLRSIDHAFADDREYAAQCLDNEAKHAAQTAAHQARVAAAEKAAAAAAKPATAPAPLRLVPRFDTIDLQNLAASWGGRTQG